MADSRDVPAETPAPLPLACPFCGQGARHDLVHYEARGHYVRCANVTCSPMPSTEGYATEAKAIAAWNRRAAPRVERDWQTDATVADRRHDVKLRTRNWADDGSNLDREDALDALCDAVAACGAVAPDAPQVTTEMVEALPTRGHVRHHSTTTPDTELVSRLDVLALVAALRAPDATPHTGDENA